MTNKNGILYAILAILAVGAVTYAVVNRPSTDSENAVQENVNATTPEAVAPSGSANQKPSNSSATKPGTSVSEETELGFYITMDNSQGPIDPQTYQVKLGQRVVVRVTTDSSDTLIVKGLNQTLSLKGDAQGEITFDADTLGLYEIRLDNQGAIIGYIEVVPDTK